MKNSSERHVGDQLTVKIDRIVPKGFGLGFSDGLTVFVPLAAAGDTLRVEITQIKKKIAFAEIVEIIEPGPDRIIPLCKYFGTCGGCDFQQMNYAAQLGSKVGIVKDCLRRIGKIDYQDEIAIIPSPKELDYRSRARWHADAKRKSIGYFKRNSHNVIDIDECPILVPELESALIDLRKNFVWENIWEETAEIDAASGDEKHVSIFSADLAEPTKDISFSTASDKYSYSARSFFQGNQFLVDDMIRLATENASGDTAIDLYCGVGLFTIPLAREFRRVIAVEENKNAIDYLKKNKESSNFSNIEIVNNSVVKFLSEHRKESIDFLLLDPPRAGTENGVINSIANMRPRQISYVSCEPSILARDLRALLDSGYKIDSITALDVFPQTHHVETIVRLNTD